MWDESYKWGILIGGPILMTLWTLLNPKPKAVRSLRKWLGIALLATILGSGFYLLFFTAPVAAAVAP